MNFFSDWAHKIGSAAEAVGGAIYAPMGFVADVATAPWHDDNQYNGFLDAVAAHAVTRFTKDSNDAEMAGQALSATGNALGAVSDSTGLTQVGQGVGKAMEGMDWLWSNAVSRPVSTVLTAEQLAKDPSYTGDQVGTYGQALGLNESLFRAKTWSDAYGLAKHRSPGQALWLGVMPSTIYSTTDEQAVANMESNPGFKIASGLTDIAAQFAGDPGIIALKGVGMARKVTLVRPMKVGQIDSYIEGRHATDFVRWATGKSAA